MSCAKLVLDEGSTLLDDAELEMLVILRMNRKFMEFMRTNYADLTRTLGKQHFGCTVVAEEAGPGVAEM